MTGRKLLLQKLSWDFLEYRKRKNRTRKKWSKIPRRFSKKELKEGILEYEECMMVEV